MLHCTGSFFLKYTFLGFSEEKYMDWHSVPAFLNINLTFGRGLQSSCKSLGTKNTKSKIQSGCQETETK